MTHTPWMLPVLLALAVWAGAVSQRFLPWQNLAAILAVTALAAWVCPILVTFVPAPPLAPTSEGQRFLYRLAAWWTSLLTSRAIARALGRRLNRTSMPGLRVLAMSIVLLLLHGWALEQFLWSDGATVGKFAVLAGLLMFLAIAVTPWLIPKRPGESGAGGWADLVASGSLGTALAAGNAMRDSWWMAGVVLAATVALSLACWKSAPPPANPKPVS